MLTNMFYYNYYKPFLFNEKPLTPTRRTSRTETTSSSKDSKKVAESDKSDSNHSFLLNKMLKKDIVDYASEFSSNINAIKDSSKFMSEDISYKKNSSEEGLYEKGLEDFAQDFNKLKTFSETSDSGSPMMSKFFNDIQGTISKFDVVISELGLSVDNNSVMHFDENKIDPSNKDFEQKKNIGKIFFKEVYDKSCDFLSTPLSEHMNFKNLDYYYNYTYSSKDKNYHFNFIESGMIVDYIL